MNNKLKEIWNHISNTKSLLAIASSVLIIINTLGLAVDSTMVMKAINALLLILVTLGIINNKGMDTPMWNK
jgi:uncharacterized membrane protein